jgi:hypothetical protein
MNLSNTYEKLISFVISAMLTSAFIATAPNQAVTTAQAVHAPTINLQRFFGAGWALVPEAELSTSAKIQTPPSITGNAGNIIKPSTDWLQTLLAVNCDITTPHMPAQFDQSVKDALNLAGDLSFREMSHMVTGVDKQSGEPRKFELRFAQIFDKPHGDTHSYLFTQIFIQPQLGKLYLYVGLDGTDLCYKGAVIQKNDSSIRVLTFAEAQKAIKLNDDNWSEEAPKLIRTVSQLVSK